ncbi:unnamed protein product [Oppiella nova]|uniref:HhH-GPD domain-containing protein n=1 Tax=Oppiella nova TaxID=334625 RepID=A0A7R9MDV5_9ACAR|nr:unnamed protein product [Oppiella nova]CAG2175417.1 unnamed protein product [Oppiella nova]
MQAKIVNKIFEIFSQIAVILSAQATDISVNKATRSLFKEYNTPEEILQLGEEKLRNYIKSIGLFNNKAKHIIALCHNLINNYNSKVPDNFNDLIKLPGVGRKTANVILNCLFDKPTMAVDTHLKDLELQKEIVQKK